MAETIKVFEYRIIETSDGKFLCSVMKDGRLYGPVHEAPTYESMCAWFRLVMGDYPEMRKVV